MLVAAASSQSRLQAFAARTPDGGLRVMAVNDDAATSYRISLSAPGYRLRGDVPVLFYGPSSSAVQHLTGRAARAAESSVPPYSVTVYSLSHD